MIDLTIATERLTLRTFRTEDAESVETLIGEWEVAKMLSRAPHPYPKGGATAWFATHDSLRASGVGYPFAIVFEDRCIGCIGLREEDGAKWKQADKVLVIGYWVGIPYWGRGLMTEAVTATVAFAFDRLAKSCLAACYFVDNPASGHILKKAGFIEVGYCVDHCLSRNQGVDSILVALTRDAWTKKQV